MASFLQRLKEEEDTRIAVIFGIFVVFPVLIVFGFYFGTVFGKSWKDDYVPADMIPGFYGAAVGAGIATIIFFVILFLYPKMVHHDLAIELAEHDDHH